MVVIGVWFLILIATTAVTLYGVIDSVAQHQITHLLMYAMITLLIFTAVELRLLIKLRAKVKVYASYWKKHSISKADEFTYIALGDSAAQGIGASSIDKSYVKIVAKEICRRTGRRVRIINLSKSGGNLQDVVAEQLPLLKKFHPDLVTIDIGANDVTGGTATAQMARDYRYIIKSLSSYPVIVANLPDFMSGTKQRKTKEFNVLIRGLCEQYGVREADLHSYTTQKMWAWNEFAADGFHPSDSGHRTWAAAFIAGIDKLQLDNVM